MCACVRLKVPYIYIIINDVRTNKNRSTRAVETVVIVARFFGCGRRLTGLRTRFEWKKYVRRPAERTGERRLVPSPGRSANYPSNVLDDRLRSSCRAKRVRKENGHFFSLARRRRSKRVAAIVRAVTLYMSVAYVRGDQVHFLNCQAVHARPRTHIYVHIPTPYTRT